MYWVYWVHDYSVLFIKLMEITSTLVPVESNIAMPGHDKQLGFPIAHLS